MAFDTSSLPAAPDERGWSFTEGFVAEPAAARIARERSTEIGVPVVSPATGAALRMLTLTSGAKHIVEIGTGTGGATVWLHEGMAAGGQVTTLDADAEHHLIAREVLAEAGLATNQIRMITGRPAEVIQRLTNQAYDLVVMSLPATELAGLLEEAVRLLRANGSLVLLNAFGEGRVPDPAQRDSASVSRRLFVQALGNDQRFACSLLPVGDGLLVATLRAS